MKKSIFYSLMSLAMLLFCSTAFAQINHTWPVDNVAIKALKGARTDTIFMCYTDSTLYPIELGYDVAGLNLHPAYGEWSLYATTGGATTAADYSFDKTIKNNGAGNAYRVTGSGLGAYLFKYTAASKLCGLAADSSVFTYVFVLPSLDDNTPGAGTYCKTANLTDSTTVTISTVWPHHELYTLAGITLTWVGTPTVWKVGTGVLGNTQYFNAVGTVTSASPKFKCSTVANFRYTATIIDSTAAVLPAKKIIKCENDSVGQGGKSPNVWFHREGDGGAYDPLTIASYTVGKNLFTYKYTNKCNGKPAEVVDTLWLIDSIPNDNRGIIEETFCRTSFNGLPYPSLDDAYRGLPFNRDPLETGSVWYDISKKGPSGASAFVDPRFFNPANIGTNVPYTFKYALNTGDCHDGDSGYLIITMKDAFVAKDYRAQLCETSIAYDFNLATFTGVPNAAWTYSGGFAGVGAITNNKITSAQLTALKGQTSKFTYVAADLSGSCGSAGPGVFYLKIGKASIIPGDVAVNYCKEKLPASLNVNEIIGFSGYPDGTNNVWTVEDVKVNGVSNAVAKAAVIAKFTASNGSLDFQELNKNDVFNLSGIVGLSTYSTITFKLDNTTCGAGAGKTVNLVVNIVEDIIRK